MVSMVKPERKKKKTKPASNMINEQLQASEVESLCYLETYPRKSSYHEAT